MGFDPGLGLLHADQRARDSLTCNLMEPVRPKVDAYVLDLIQSRDSLPCDLMEPVRPKVDAYVLALLQSRTFSKHDFFETRQGICRIMPPLTHELAETATIWAKELAPVTERVARELFASALYSTKKTSLTSKLSKSIVLPTPLTKSNRSASRAPYRRKPEPKTLEEIRAWLFG
jgi:CRISPR associated protein Cas1